MKGSIPTQIVREIAIPKMLTLPRTLQIYFQKVLAQSQCTAADGKYLGHMLMDLAKAAEKSNRASAIRTFVMETAMLRDCELSSFDAMLIGIFDQHFELLAQDVPKADPAALTATEAAAIGRGLEAIVRISADHFEATDELLRKYPSLNETAQRHVWFRPMLETIAKRRMEAAPLGLKLRLAIGAIFSMGDMASDLVQIVGMFVAGQNMRAMVLLGMIAMSLAIQAIVVILQTAHRGWQVVVWELGIVFSLLKPGIDAIRVAGGEERVEGAPLDQFAEMAFCKVSELTFESIAGGLAQAIFLLDGGDWTTAAVASVGLSCISTAFAVTMLAYDYDTHAAKRKKNPEFFGYIPSTSTGRLMAFGLLFLYHSAYTTGKTFSMAVLALTNWRWLVSYVLADHCGFIIYKLARGDLIYWVPGCGALSSLLVRFVEKVIVDFTRYACTVHIRRAQPRFALAANPNIRSCSVAVVFTFATRSSWEAFISSSTRW
jgi:hypothetical protein